MSVLHRLFSRLSCAPIVDAVEAQPSDDVSDDFNSEIRDQETPQPQGGNSWVDQELTAYEDSPITVEPLPGQIEDWQGLDLFCDHNPKREVAIDDSLDELAFVNLPAVPFRKILGLLDEWSRRSLRRTSKAMNKVVADLEKPEKVQKLEDFVMSLRFNDRKTCPFMGPSLCRIRALCSGKRIDWHIKERCVVIRKCGYEYFRKWWSFEELMGKILANVRWSKLTIDGFKDEWNGLEVLFVYRGFSVTVNEIHKLLNKSPLYETQLPEMTVHDFEVVLMGFRRIRDKFACAVLGKILNDEVTPTCEWRFAERAVIYTGDRQLSIISHDTDRKDFLNWLAQGISFDCLSVTDDQSTVWFEEMTEEIFNEFEVIIHLSDQRIPIRFHHIEAP